LLAAAIVVASAISIAVGTTVLNEKLQTTAGNDYSEAAESFALDEGVPPPVSDVVGAVPIGDNAMRLAFGLASLTYAIHHPIGVGFNGEIGVVGWYAHNDLIRTMVEQGVLGTLAFLFLNVALVRLFARERSKRSLAMPEVIIRSLTIALVCGGALSISSLMQMKFGAIFWTVLGAATTPRRTTLSLFVRRNATSLQRNYSNLQPSDTTAGSPCKP
jgi:hypothetical protein